MKEYTVKVAFSGHGYITVEAENEDDAIRKAAEDFDSSCFHEWRDDSYEIDSEEDLNEETEA